jgi:hypothetical protein
MGMVCNSVTGKLYDTPLQIVIGKYERYYIEWLPNRGSFVATHLVSQIEDNGRINTFMRDDKNKLFDPKTGNNFVDTYVYYIIMPGHMRDEVCIMSLSSSFLKEAKKLNRLLMTTFLPGTDRKAPPFSMVWDFNVIEMNKGDNDWYGPAFKFSHFVLPAELEYVQEQRKQLPNKTVDYTQIEETTSESGDAPNGADEEVKY